MPRKFMLSPVTLFVALVVSSIGLPLALAADEQKDLGKIGAKLSDPTSDAWALFTEFDFTYMI